MSRREMTGSRAELSPQASALILLLGLVFVPVTLVLIGLFWPGLFLPAVGLFGGGGLVAAIRVGRHLFDEVHKKEAWQRDLPPPALPSMPPPSTKTIRTGAVGCCPWDGRPLPGFGSTTATADTPADRWTCTACLSEVLASSLFENQLERYGLSREVIMGLAELHPTDRVCPGCGRRLASPPLRDTRPLVCRGCGTAVFSEGELAVFRGEARPKRAHERPRVVDHRGPPSGSGHWSEKVVQFRGSVFDGGAIFDSDSDSDGDGGGDGGDGGGDGGG